ncbi:bifunctional riboflavin kinase/FAD synthetase [Sporosarcina pasteurii]|uniref:Riboflavin biosynthesis protein n=1 Tax=Sporosarcina pasteurii TaxID=1474 RepID=A0A380BI34_SPOPA|nr:bifunctional riboflavin kinase/FAD synthetase [Sporosarcina pasteurii]MDS9470627.1 bifunctional riboflavin kinase/FAD synthetase [Sporosarcina pasteurii]QBQ05686.1 bifunctional riboflavin kinase/FAD synthetase [Sporosarcina pasteurii]SUJ01333.1 Riboflavin biosynthesis protein ribF [Sporosarcina pasteurii]
MEIYELNYPNRVSIDQEGQYSLAIGFFDGLHKGHQTVIQKAIDKAKELEIQSAVMTFNPHPSHVLGDGKNKVGYITPFEEKVTVLQSLGVDVVFVVKFDKALASLSPEQFVDVFIKKLGVKHVTAGFDYSFGAKGAGTMNDMERLSNDMYGTTIVGKVIDQEDKVSSTRIRILLSEGKVEEAAILLGRNFRTIGTVVDGDKNGRKLGFPTANILPPEDSILPLNGVYAVQIIIDGKKYDGVCNVGVKPTFEKGQQQATVEVHILDFDEDIYGKTVAVEWIYFIRPEKKFDSFNALIEQISKDKERAKELLLER